MPARDTEKSDAAALLLLLTCGVVPVMTPLRAFFAPFCSVVVCVSRLSFSFLFCRYIYIYTAVLGSRTRTHIREVSSTRAGDSVGERKKEGRERENSFTLRTRLTVSCTKRLEMRIHYGHAIPRIGTENYNLNGRSAAFLPRVSLHYRFVFI